MKFLVFGSRSFQDYAFLSDKLGWIVSREDEIITGGAVGADSLAERWAREHGVSHTLFKPDYEQHGDEAPLMRNALMAEEADKGICFYDGCSRGTIHTLQELAKRGKHTQVYGVGE